MSTEISTSRLTEDIQADQKKILYRGSLDLLTSSGTADGFGYYTITQTKTFANIKSSNLSHEIINVTRNPSGGGTAVLIFQGQHQELYPSSNIYTTYSYLSSSGGQLKLTVVLRIGDTLDSTHTWQVYYIIYSNIVTYESLL